MKTYFCAFRRDWAHIDPAVEGFLAILLLFGLENCHVVLVAVVYEFPLVSTLNLVPKDHKTNGIRVWEAHSADNMGFSGICFARLIGHVKKQSVKQFGHLLKNPKFQTPLKTTQRQAVLSPNMTVD